jgi:protein-tyrosine-phosphatase
VTQPVVLFLCVHNAGRSQIAAAFARRLGADRITVISAGSDPADSLDPAVITAMGEAGLDITAEVPRAVTDEMARAADVVVAMGCGDACPIYPGTRRLEWDLADPSGRPLDEVRAIRDEIAGLVESLVEELAGPPG